MRDDSRLRMRAALAALAGILTLLGPSGLPADPQGPAAELNLKSYEGPDGFAVVVLKKLEKSGVLSITWGGTFEFAGFSPGEDCDDNEGECYQPRVRTAEFKLKDDDNPVLLNFLKANRGKEMFVRYDLPLFGEEWQLIDAVVWSQHPVRGLPPAVRVPPSGSRRDFTVYGRVLRLERTGSVQTIWEGLYLDQRNRRVHAVSITNERIVAYLALAMASRESYHLGVSVAYFPGFRNSTHDIYEINYATAPAPP